jgi:signal recognition particle receptor subunit beta
MAFLNEYTGEINLKALIVGAAASGKTTNLRSAYKQTCPDLASRVFDLHGLPDDASGFDFLPLSLGVARGRPARLHLYTLPSHDFFKTLNQALFLGVDGVIFIVDSRSHALPENERQFERIGAWCQVLGRRLEDVPLVFQFNHRDAPDALSIRALRSRYARDGAVGVEAVAVQDVGVLETIDAAADAILATMEGPAAGRPRASAIEYRTP